MLSKVSSLLQSSIVLPPFEAVRQIFTPFVFFSVMHLRNDMCWQHGEKGGRREGRGGGQYFFSWLQIEKMKKSKDKLACARYHIASVEQLSLKHNKINSTKSDSKSGFDSSIKLVRFQKELWRLLRLFFRNFTSGPTLV